MPAARPREVWQTDLGMQAKVRPCLVLTPPPAAENELAVFTLVAHTTSIRGSRWEVNIPKPFLDDGAFDVQRIVTVANVKLQRKLGELTSAEFRNSLGAPGGAVGSLTITAKAARAVVNLPLNALTLSESPSFLERRVTTSPTSADASSL